MGTRLLTTPDILLVLTPDILSHIAEHWLIFAIRLLHQLRTRRSFNFHKEESPLPPLASIRACLKFPLLVNFHHSRTTKGIAQSKKQQQPLVKYTRITTNKYMKRKWLAVDHTLQNKNPTLPPSSRQDYIVLSEVRTSGLMISNNHSCLVCLKTTPPSYPTDKREGVDTRSKVAGFEG